MTMRKLFAIATVLVFVFAVSNVYACGEKNGSAKASRASSNSSCAAKAAKAEKASMDDSMAKAVEVQTANVNVKSEKAEVINADYSNMAGTGHCAPGAKAAAMKADAATAKVCPATADCPDPCVKDTKVEKMKADNSEKTPQLSASPQPAVSPVVLSE
jgi:hypothetical protein